MDRGQVANPQARRRIEQTYRRQHPYEHPPHRPLQQLKVKSDRQLVEETQNIDLYTLIAMLSPEEQARKYDEISRCYVTEYAEKITLLLGSGMPHLGKLEWYDPVWMPESFTTALSRTPATDVSIRWMQICPVFTAHGRWKNGLHNDTWTGLLNRLHSIITVDEKGG
jgi:hypothetical protein